MVKKTKFDIEVTLGEPTIGIAVAFFIQEDPKLPPREMTIQEGMDYLQKRFGFFIPKSELEIGRNFWYCTTEQEAQKLREQIAQYKESKVQGDVTNILDNPEK